MQTRHHLPISTSAEPLVFVNVTLFFRLKTNNKSLVESCFDGFLVGISEWCRDLRPSSPLHVCELYSNLTDSSLLTSLSDSQLDCSSELITSTTSSSSSSVASSRWHKRFFGCLTCSPSELSLVVFSSRVLRLPFLELFAWGFWDCFCFVWVPFFALVDVFGMIWQM